MPALPRRLITRKRRFIKAYLETLNGTKAAIAAGYSPNGANVIGSRLLSDPTVKAAIAADLAACEVSAPRVLREIGGSRSRM